MEVGKNFYCFPIMMENISKHLHKMKVKTLFDVYLPCKNDML